MRSPPCRQMGMEDILVKRDALLAAKAGKKPPASPDCRRCQDAMRHMQREFDLDEIRSNYAEVELYLKEVCDDMKGWLKPDVVKWCRATMGEKKNNVMISGLVQMYPGNLIESVCSLGMKLCEKEEADPAASFEATDLVMLKVPHTGCLDGLDDVGEVKQIGMAGNGKQVLVRCEARNAETYYPIDTLKHKPNATDDGEEACAAAAERKAAGASGAVGSRDLAAAAAAAEHPPAAAADSPGGGAEVVGGGAAAEWAAAKKEVEAAAKAKRKARIRVEKAEKELEKAEKQEADRAEKYGRLLEAFNAMPKPAADSGDDVVATFTSTDGGGVKEL
eukprot:SAG22_NODE_269_length_13236_cov_124.463424_3_plen_333_part_00